MALDMFIPIVNKGRLPSETAPQPMQALLDAAAAVPGTGGAPPAFDEFVSGGTHFGERIRPLIVSRKRVVSTEAC